MQMPIAGWNTVGYNSSSNQAPQSQEDKDFTEATSLYNELEPYGVLNTRYSYHGWTTNEGGGVPKPNRGNTLSFSSAGAPHVLADLRKLAGEFKLLQSPIQLPVKDTPSESALRTSYMSKGGYDAVNSSNLSPDEIKQLIKDYHEALTLANEAEGKGQGPGYGNPLGMPRINDLSTLRLDERRAYKASFDWSKLPASIQAAVHKPVVGQPATYNTKVSFNSQGMLVNSDGTVFSSPSSSPSPSSDSPPPSSDSSKSLEGDPIIKTSKSTIRVKPADASLADLAFMVLSERATIMDTAIRTQMKQIENNNIYASDLTAAMNGVNAYSEKGGALDKITVIDSKGKSKDIATFLTENNISFPAGKKASDSLSKEEIGIVVKAINGKIESLASSTQLDIIQLQSSMTKYNQVFDMLSNILSKLAQSQQTIIGNIRG